MQGSQNAARIDPPLPQLGPGPSNTHDSIGDAFHRKGVGSSGFHQVDRRGRASTVVTRSSFPFQWGAFTTVEARSLFTLSDTSGGALADTQFARLLAGGLVRPPKMRDLLTVIPVVSDKVGVVQGVRRGPQPPQQ